MVNRTELGAQEWQDTLFLWYGIKPPDHPRYCDGCNANFSICHALNCKRGGLVTSRHNGICDGVADLAGKAFTPPHIHDESLIFAYCTMKRPKTNPARSKSKAKSSTPQLESTEQKGHLLIRDPWNNGTNSVHGIRVVNTDYKSHSAKTPGKCL